MSRRYVWSPRNVRQGTASQKTAWMMRGTGERVHTIPASVIGLADAEVSSEPGFEVLCSYNWQKNGRPILVPGGPPKWAPPPLPVTLSEDSDYQFIDQNAFYEPRHPFKPVFHALSIMNPGIRLDDIDIIVNRNSLRKLLDFAAGKRPRPFRIDLQMVKDTLFITRKEKYPRETDPGSISGHGQNLERAFTKPESGLESSSSHHRVIRYHLGHLNCVVRFEVDAYYEGPDDPSLADTSPQLVEDATALMAHPAVNGPVARRGTSVNSSKLAEIKAGKFERINEYMPQLWFGRTPHLLTGKHVAGNFHSVSYTHVGLQFKEWETAKANQDNLRKLVTLLTKLMCIVRKTEGKAAILLCEDRGAPLQIFKAENETSVLPKDILVKHWDLGAGEGN